MDAIDGRTCGECSLCCKIMAVGALNKPKGVWCNHFADGAGCTIYDKRPGECRTFSCLWLINSRMGPEWKPSVCGMMVTAEGAANLVVHVDDVSPGAAWREPYLTWLQRAASLSLDHGGTVLVIEHGQTTLVLPDRGINLGIVGDDDRIVLGEVASHGGPRQWEAKVMKKDEAEQFVARVAKERADQSGEAGPKSQ